MAEGFARQAGLAAFSAGTNPKAVDPLALKVMAEVGIDISSQSPKHASDFAQCTFDLVVTVCDSAHEACPVFPGAARTIHHGFDDPPRLAQGATTDEEAVRHYRRVRDEIRRFVQTLPRAIEGSSAPAKAAHYSAAALSMRPDVDGAAYWAVALTQAMLTRFEVKPGARFDRHAHDAEQITMVLKGSLTFEFDSQPPVTVGPGEVIAIPSGLPHAATAGPSGADAVDAWSPPRSEFTRAIPAP
jgi:arsenate reductase